MTVIVNVRGMRMIYLFIFWIGLAEAQQSNLYPDHAITPGVVDCTLTTKYLCSHSTKERRNVTDATKKQVCANYGNHCASGKQEIDHFIPLTLGGKNDIKNLWPQLYEPRPGAHEKDVLETFLHRQLCSSKIGLFDAQSAVRHDWVKAYNLMKAGKPIAPAPTGKAQKKCVAIE